MFDVLLIGCGNIAGGFDADREGLPPLTHAGAFGEHPEFRIAACVDPDAARREAFQARWSVPEGAADLAALDAEPGRFDVIGICSPTVFHAEHLEAALALRPRLIFCEKPVTPSASETEHWAARAAETGVLLAVNHTRRWAPDIVRLAAELRDGTHGAIRSIAATYNKGVLNNGAHMIDLLRMIVGDVRVVHAGVPVRDFWPDDPTIPAMLESASGIPIQLSVADARDYALFELSVITENAVIAMEEGGLSWRIRRAGASGAFAGYRALDPGERIAGEYFEAMRGAVANVAAALRDGAPLASDGASALAAQRVCEAIREAAASHSQDRA
ncbi:Gfo/Idh/MocA family protein [Sphingomonas sp. LT1P40]|uniref:Gfo/Idh/MocA family protein n=1 Tax=Alteristakelama amylovorans TaxID=3096166 RepID=UPI002FC8B808